jgi:hypothetical protein
MMAAILARPMHMRGLLVTVLMLAASLSSESRAAAELQLTADGWHSWRVASVSDGDEETILVRVKSGVPTDIEILGHWCNRHRHDDAIDHGVLNADTSIDWLQQYLGRRDDLGEDALAAISRHAGDRALQILIGIVESDADADARQEAIFWMAMSESEAAFEYIDGLLMAE